MKQLNFLVLRNLQLFRKNSKNVILCFFSIFIVYSLYSIFLRDFMIASALKSGVDSLIVDEFTDRLMLGGLLIVVNTTTCFGIMQLSIHDLETGITRDFRISPVKRTQIMIGYWMTSIAVSFLYTGIAFLGILCYCFIEYSTKLPIQYVLGSFLLIFISSVLNSELLLCLITVIKDTTTFSTFGNLYGMMAGFLAGTYLPYDLYPDRLKQILFYYPPTHLTSSMRQILLAGINSNSQNGGQEFWDRLYLVYGVHLRYQQQLCTPRQHILVLCGSFAIMLFFLGIVHSDQ